MDCIYQNSEFICLIFSEKKIKQLLKKMPLKCSGVKVLKYSKSLKSILCLLSGTYIVCL